MSLRRPGGERRGSLRPEATAAVGWYFAAALCFHGHNNEIAGAARIERFKQFVRVRVNREGLTGYVIAIDYPKRNGRDLRPRLVDVFHICGKP